MTAAKNYNSTFLRSRTCMNLSTESRLHIRIFIQLFIIPSPKISAKDMFFVAYTLRHISSSNVDFCFQFISVMLLHFDETIELLLHGPIIHTYALLELLPCFPFLLIENLIWIPCRKTTTNISPNTILHRGTAQADLFQCRFSQNSHRIYMLFFYATKPLKSRSQSHSFLYTICSCNASIVQYFLYICYLFFRSINIISKSCIAEPSIFCFFLDICQQLRKSIRFHHGCRIYHWAGRIAVLRNCANTRLQIRAALPRNLLIRELFLWIRRVEK